MPDKYIAKSDEKPECNLLYESWIKVLTKDYKVIEVSLLDAILHSQDYICLAGDMGTQDVAITRVMLAFLKTVFSRYDLDGNLNPLTKKNAFDRAEQLIKLGRFPEAPIRKYAEQWHDRFYLFHPDHPFYQIPVIDSGTEYNASKLNGQLMESGNSPRFTTPVTGESKESMSYAEAARWLITINGYDDAGLKKKHGNNLPSIGTGWLGQICSVLCIGRNLFKTLMYNLTFLRDGTKMWGSDHPIWEEDPCLQERREIPVPDNMAGLLTLQSRRMLLKRQDGRVVGFYTYGGDFFDRENAVIEQMAAWKTDKVKETGKECFVPAKPNSAWQSWQSMIYLVSDGEGHHMPGVIKWIEALIDRGIIPEDEAISVRLVAAFYTSMSAKMKDTFDETVTFPSSLLSSKGEVWEELLVDEADRCEKRSGYVGAFATEIAKAVNMNDKSASEVRSHAKMQFYSKISSKFRRLVANADPSQTEEEREIILDDWNRFADKAAYEVADGMSEYFGINAFIGRTDGKGRHHSTPEAMNSFSGSMWKLNGKK